MIHFNENPVYDLNTNRLILPSLEGYKIELFGSDRLTTVSIDGAVTRPLNTQVVNVLYKITDLKTGKTWETDKNAHVEILGLDADVSSINEKPTVVPSLREWIGYEGYLVLDDATKLVYHDSDFEDYAHRFVEDYYAVTGRTLEAVHGDERDVADHDFYFVIDETEAMLTKGAYYLEVGHSKSDQGFITIRSNNLLGLSYGGVSLLQILQQDETKNRIPKGIAKDYPQFQYRGYMLDVARKYIKPQYLRDTMKVMHYFKMNAFALHLNDNDIWNSLSLDHGKEALSFFRLESEQYPELMSKDFYTKEEFRMIQRFGSALGITVIPEIDTPGHTKAFTDVWPELKLEGQDKYLDVRNPKVLEIVRNLFDEYIHGYKGQEPTFLGEYVNIGTDEYKGGSAYKEDFRQYTNTLLNYIKDAGKEPVFWGSLKENDGQTEVMTEALMFAWYKGYADVKKSLLEGYHVVSMEDHETYIVPGGGWYAKQFGQAERLYNEWLPNDNTGWDDRPAPSGHPRVLGGQFAVWNDYPFNGITDDDISYRVQHNLYTIAQKTWSADDLTMPYEQFSKVGVALLNVPNADFLYNTNDVKKKYFSLNESFIESGTLLNVIEADNVDIWEDSHFELTNESMITLNQHSVGFNWTLVVTLKLKNTHTGTLLKSKDSRLGIDGGVITFESDIYKRTFDDEDYDYDINKDEWTTLVLTGTYEGVSLYVNGKFVGDTINKVYPNFNCEGNIRATKHEANAPHNGECNTPFYYQTLMLPTASIGDGINTINASIKQFKIMNHILSEDDIKTISK